MVKYKLKSLDAIFSALSDPTRRAILSRLAQGDRPVMELARPFNVSLPAISKHLRVLENAGLLARQKDGRIRWIRLVAEPLKDAAEWIEYYRQFWEGQLDRLSDYLDQLNKKEDPSWQPRTPVSKRHFRSNGPFRPPGKRSSGPGRTRKS